jgi:uroporphyrin-III C-methyltransferase/precorrin-2 dehydrogenase/sirohydrochlorin ferrochelatase
MWTPRSIDPVQYFPAFLDLNDRPCLVVGGGAPAARKARLLERAGARLTVVARRAIPEIEDLEAAGALRLVRRGFVAGDVKGCAAVVSATGLGEVDARVSEAARAAGVPINVVDRPELSSFVAPAIVERDPVVIGISSGGASPVLARRLRARIEALLPARLGRLARFAESFRAAVRATVPDPAHRQRFWTRVFDGPVAEDVLAGREAAARERMLGLVNRPGTARAPEGLVHIVGAGPGDPDLLTVKALGLMERADVAVYDRLVTPEILDRLRRDAERIYVGKAKGAHALSQDQINALLLAQARAGKRVLRLKGGDPFVFGRGGEELDYLRRHGVRVEVVPGVTAATACAAALGVPLSHRDHASAVTLVTGHGRDGEPELDWAALASGRQTLAVYMGVETAGRTAARLIAQGLAPGTPAAVIENGTLASQKAAVGALRDLEALVRDNGITGPALILIGEVVRLADAQAPAERPRALAV